MACHNQEGRQQSLLLEMPDRVESKRRVQPKLKELSSSLNIICASGENLYPSSAILVVCVGLYVSSRMSNLYKDLSQVRV